MPPKYSESTATEKAFTLYKMLFFSNLFYSHGQIASRLQCSKATVTRLVRILENYCGEELQRKKIDGQAWYAIQHTVISSDKITLSPRELTYLSIARDLAQTFLPTETSEVVCQAIQRISSLLTKPEKKDETLEQQVYSNMKGILQQKGSQKILDTLLDAIHKKIVCLIQYRNGKILEVAPLRLVASKDALYIESVHVNSMETVKGTGETLLALHRIISIQPTQRTHSIIPNHSVDGIFGLMNSEEAFHVAVKFPASSSDYVQERMFSIDQQLERDKTGCIILRFTARSLKEVVSWALSFGSKITILEPSLLIALYNQEITNLYEKNCKK